MRGRILDGSRRLVAFVEVEEEANSYRGEVVNLSTDDTLRPLFLDYEAAVNGQLLVEVDHLEVEVEALQAVLISEVGEEIPISDLQIYPSKMMVSFRRAIC